MIYLDKNEYNGIGQGKEKQHRVGIVGCGGIGAIHFDSYIAEGLNVVALTDANISAAEKLSEKSAGAVVYKNCKELLDKADVDIISVCTPPVSHEDPVIMSLEHGVNVLCEKPLSYDINSAYKMRDAAKASKVLIMPAFRHRFIAANIKMKEIVSSGKIGDVVEFNNIFGGPAFNMEGKWFTKKEIAGGGCILDTNSHSIDLFRYIVGEVVEQHGVMHRHFTSTNVEDAGTLIVKAQNGALGCMSSSFVYGDGIAYIDIVGTKGRMIYDYFKSDKLSIKLKDDSEWTLLDVEGNIGFQEEIAHFAGAVEGKHPLGVTIDDGVRAMEIICSLY